MKPIHAAPASMLISLTLFGIAVGEERVLVERRSDYNEILVSEDEQGLRIMRFEPGGARQSVVKPGDPDHLELPYARAIPVGLVLVDRPQRVLVVGLGGGTIPSLLRKHDPQLKIDVVELDPAVIELAKQYFEFREDAGMRAYAQDGRAFIEQRRNLYDIIFLDAFSADNIPFDLATREFLYSVRRALKPRGIVVGNVWSRYSNPLYDPMVRTYRDVFEDVYIVDVPAAGNKLVLGLPWRSSLAKAEVVRRARELSQRFGLRYELGAIVEQGFRPAGQDGATGPVLLDRDRPNGR